MLEKVTTAADTGNRSWSYVPVASLALPRVFAIVKTEIISTVF